MSVHTSLSLALVGLGSWGQKIARTLNEEITSASLDFVVTSNENPHDFVLPYCQVFNSVNALLSSDVKVDGVILALPPHLNKAASLKIMAAGIPLFIEKPMAMSIADATEMLDFARARKAIVAVDHIDLHHSAITQLRRLQPGVPTHLEAKIGAAYNPRENWPPLWEYSPHFIAAALEFCGELPDTISSRALPVDADLSQDVLRENIEVTMTFSNGSTATVVGGNGMAKKTRQMAVTYGNDVYHFVDREDPDLFVEHLDSGQSQPLSSPNRMPLGLSLESFIAKVQRGQSCCEEFELGLNVVKILTGADLSRQTKQPVRWSAL
ncbi:Gfo/Idh/MocA family protein [Pseudoalteromonas sp. DY56-GL79]|uniref:Gfo/Idh/MocA family protein n=1 Tax=Pseudoalteromonas TaxID=53246 RepID=UPI00352AA663